MYPIVFACTLPIRRQSSVFVTWHRALKVLLFTCRKIVIDPNTCAALPPNAFILTVSGLRVSHSCLQSFFACLRPITLQPAPVSTSQSICSISESFDLDIYTGRMCSEFLSLSQQASTVAVCIIFTEVWGIFVSFLNMKNRGGWSDLLLYGCA